MNAARGLALGFQLLLAASGGTSTLASTDGIPEVGIGAVHPICDPLQEECISGDEQVQDEIIAGLQAVDTVTAIASVVELGELLCDSLDQASSSTLLRFGISSSETVTAERTSYSEFDGAAFSDDKQRKIWKGEVVDPAPAADAAPRTISMTWTSPCETETFALKMTALNFDGTLSITTSKPCAAGSSMDICVVQYDVDLPLPADPSETARDVTRHLTEHQPSGEELAGELVEDSDPLLWSRKLQSTVEIDVMFLYDEGALLSNGDPWATAEQMETLIANELPSSNEATANSLIDLRFNLVHTGKLPYLVPTENYSTELSRLRQNGAVQALRDQHAADLVVLVGIFPDVCGAAYLNRYTTAEDEAYGYSVINRTCFDGRTTTHELGHNLGADHDRSNSQAVFDYGHGLRYCGATDFRYRTIMAYPCSYNTQPEETSGFAYQANFFSNPDVEYDELPTGTSAENNAQTLRDNMVVVSNFRNSAEQMCAAGIPGILNDDVCCPTSCGACGGPGCNGRNGGDDFTGREACCQSGVATLGRICSATVGAPCVVGEEPTCAAGIPGILNNDVCCPTSCGACGGSGCSGRDGGDDFTGSEACCVGGVTTLGRVCSATVGAPCVVAEEPTCAAGIPGILNNDVCCPTSCGACGGSGCNGRNGGDDFTGREACCQSGVTTLGRICSATVGAPCVVAEDDDDDEGEFTCDGVQKGDYCCSDGCGECGGSGCSNRGGGLTGDDCCTSNILASGRLCSATRAAPCFLD